MPCSRLRYSGCQSKNSQDAYECVRPTDPTLRPEHVRKYLKEDQYRLYELIWQRFMASQMTPAIFDTTTVDFDFDRFLFRATGSVVKFDGYQRLYKESREAEEGKALEEEQGLPVVQKGEDIPVKAITPSQHFTEPPPRYSEASLVKELERLGIGRPSTYASIVSTLVDRRYAQLEQRRFFPTFLGEQVERVMVKSFPDVFNVRFTSHMETDLDKIEDGDVNWRKMLKDFYGPFAESVKSADIESLIGEAHDLSMLETERCPTCGGKLVPRGDSSDHSWRARTIRRIASSRGLCAAIARQRSRLTRSATSVAARWSFATDAPGNSSAAARSRSAAAHGRCRPA